MQSSLVEDMEGVEATGMDILTDQEKRILELYDRLEELQLEMALLKARGVLSQGGHPEICFYIFSPLLDTPVEATEEDIKAAEQDLLRSKALYQIRTNIVEHVLVGSPMLRAVQNRDTGLIEQLVPHLIHPSTLTKPQRSPPPHEAARRAVYDPS